MNHAFLDIIRLSARTGRVPSQIPVHYLEWARAYWQQFRGRRKPAGKPRPMVIRLPNIEQ